MLAPEHVSAFGKEYVIGRLDLFESLNVCRIASPILPVIFANLLASIVDYMKRQEEEEAAGKADNGAERNVVAHDLRHAEQGRFQRCRAACYEGGRGAV